MNPMKIVVVFKWLKNPEDARVGSDGSVDWRGAKMTVSDDDPAAIQVARNLAAAGGEIVGLTIGDGDAAWAAARGASSTVIVTDAQSNADVAATGAVLAAGVRRIGGAERRAHRRFRVGLRCVRGVGEPTGLDCSGRRVIGHDGRRPAARDAQVR